MSQHDGIDMYGAKNAFTDHVYNIIHRRNFENYRKVLTSTIEIFRSRNKNEKGPSDRGIYIDLLSEGANGCIWISDQDPDVVVKSSLFDAFAVENFGESDFWCADCYWDAFWGATLQHKWLAETVDVELKPGGLFVIQKRYDGSVYGLRHQLSGQVLLKMVWQIGQALQYLHNNDLGHFDIGGGNVFFRLSDDYVRRHGFSEPNDYVTRGKFIFALKSSTNHDDDHDRTLFDLIGPNDIDFYLGDLGRVRYLSDDISDDDVAFGDSFGAQQYCHLNERPNSKSDVYSLGILVWQLMDISYDMSDNDGQDWYCATSAEEKKKTEFDYNSYSEIFGMPFAKIIQLMIRRSRQDRISLELMNIMIGRLMRVYTELDFAAQKLGKTEAAQHGLEFFDRFVMDWMDDENENVSPAKLGIRPSSSMSSSSGSVMSVSYDEKPSETLMTAATKLYSFTISNFEDMAQYAVDSEHTVYLDVGGDSKKRFDTVVQQRFWKQFVDLYGEPENTSSAMDRYAIDLQPDESIEKSLQSRLWNWSEANYKKLIAYDEKHDKYFNSRGGKILLDETKNVLFDFAKRFQIQYGTRNSLDYGSAMFLMLDTHLSASNSLCRYSLPSWQLEVGYCIGWTMMYFQYKMLETLALVIYDKELL